MAARMRSGGRSGKPYQLAFRCIQLSANHGTMAQREKEQPMIKSSGSPQSEEAKDDQQTHGR